MAILFRVVSDMKGPVSEDIATQPAQHRVTVTVDRDGRAWIDAPDGRVENAVEMTSGRWSFSAMEIMP